MIVAYTDLYPSMLIEVAGCPQPTILRTMKDTMIEFCRQTEAFREALGPFSIVANQENYNLAPTWDATIQRIWRVDIDGGEQAQETYSLLDDMKLHWEYGYVPTAAITASTEDTGLEVEVVLLPNYDHDQVDPAFLNRYHRAIIGGTLYALMMMPKKKWSDPNRAVLHKGAYDDGTAQAIREKHVKHKQGPLRVQPRRWC